MPGVRSARAAARPLRRGETWGPSVGRSCARGCAAPDRALQPNPTCRARGARSSPCSHNRVLITQTRNRDRRADRRITNRITNRAFYTLCTMIEVVCHDRAISDLRLPAAFGSRNVAHHIGVLFAEQLVQPQHPLFARDWVHFATPEAHPSRLVQRGGLTLKLVD